MASDQVLARELKSLQEELSAAQRDRPAISAAPPVQPPSSAEPIHEDEEKHALRDQLSELANTVTSFLEDAQEEISAHPAQSVVGALVAGILIGWLLGRRGGR